MTQRMPRRARAAPALAWLALLAAPAAGARTPVEVVLPREATLAATLDLTGSVSAERSAQVSVDVDGLIARVAVDAGDRVEAGEVLLELDDTLARLALARARAVTAQGQAQADEAARLADEARRLAADGHLPATEAATRAAAVGLAQAALAAARAAEQEQAERVRRHRLRAPFAGVIAARMAEQGEWVAPGSALFSLVALDRVRLDLQAPQERFAEIRPGAAVEVEADAAAGSRLPGTVQALVPVGTGGARSFLVRVLVEDAEGRLLPGTSARARIRLPDGDRAVLAVPGDALLRYPDGSHGVFVVVDEGEGPVARARKVELGRRAGDEVELLSGLAASEPVVVRGNEVLRDGEPVRTGAAD